MRSSFTDEEIITYAACPERERFRSQAVTVPDSEAKYRECIRTIMARFFTELMDGHKMSYAELRRMWSTYWDVPMKLVDRNFRKDNKSFLNAALTEEEILMLRGLKFLETLSSDRRIYTGIEPLVVDEPYSVNFGNFTIEGRYDMVWTYPNKNIWIGDWSHTHMSRTPDVNYNLKHALMLKAFEMQFGKHPTGVLVDFVPLGLDFTAPSYRTPVELKKQLQESANIARGIQFNLHHRVVGPHCRTDCPYVAQCLGSNHVRAKERIKSKK